MNRGGIPGSERGDVPVLAVFAIFSILIAGAAITHFRTTRRQQSQTIRKLTAADVVEARASSIESDLNEALETAITASMWEVGMESGGRENVENRVYEIINGRVKDGWDYGTVEEDIPRLGGHNLRFYWQPDGSVLVHGLIDAEVEHVKGPSSFGLELYSNPDIRFRRIKKVAGLAADRAKTADDLDSFEREINENFRCEGLRIRIVERENTLEIEVDDLYGAQTVIKPPKIPE